LADIVIPWPIPLPEPPHPGPLQPEPIWVDFGGMTSAEGGATAEVGGASSTVGVANVPAAPVGGAAIGSPSPVGAFNIGEFMLWLAALAVLWMILTAIKEAGYPAFANGIAGLIIFGALLFMGKDAIANAQKLGLEIKGK
jgi:hypothetical protein